MSKGQSSAESGAFTVLEAAGKYWVTAVIENPKLAAPKPVLVKINEGSMVTVQLIFESVE